MNLNVYIVRGVVVCKAGYKNKASKSGFVALFFIVSIAMALSSIVFSLSHLNSFYISLLDQYRDKDTARHAAAFCKRYLYTRLLYEPDFAPALHKSMRVDVHSTCQYESFSLGITGSTYTYSFVVLGISKHNFKFLLKGKLVEDSEDPSSIFRKF